MKTETLLADLRKIKNERDRNRNRIQELKSQNQELKALENENETLLEKQYEIEKKLGIY